MIVCEFGPMVVQIITATRRDGNPVCTDLLRNYMITHQTTRPVWPSLLGL